MKYLDYDGNDVYTPTRMGTKKDPMIIKAYNDVQYVGCSGKKNLENNRRTSGSNTKKHEIQPISNNQRVRRVSGVKET